MNGFAIDVAQFLASAFLAVLFLQSGFDKVFAWKDNREYIAGYFSKTFLSRMSTLLLLKITVMEVLTGVFAAAGCLWLVLKGDSSVAWGAAVLAAVTILALFTGQRIAKDYASAAAMVPYALLALASVLLQGWGLHGFDIGTA